MTTALPSVTELAHAFTQKSLEAPLTSIQLEDDFEAYKAANVEEWAAFAGDKAKGQLRGFVKQSVRNFFKDFDLQLLVDMTTELTKKVQARPEVDYTKFNLVGEVTTQEVQDVLGKIYTMVSTTQGEKDEINHQLSVLKMARGFLISLQKAFEAFIMDETVCPYSFKHLSERTRFMETLLADIGIYDQRIAGLRSLLDNLLNNVLSPRLNLLIRSDSAVRLVVKHEEQDWNLNRGQTHGNTQPQGTGRDISDEPSEMADMPQGRPRNDGPGFAIEEV